MEKLKQKEAEIRQFQIKIHEQVGEKQEILRLLDNAERKFEDLKRELSAPRTEAANSAAGEKNEDETEPATLAYLKEFRESRTPKLKRSPLDDEAALELSLAKGSEEPSPGKAGNSIKDQQTELKSNQASTRQGGDASSKQQPAQPAPIGSVYDYVEETDNKLVLD